MWGVVFVRMYAILSIIPLPSRSFPSSKCSIHSRAYPNVAKLEDAAVQGVMGEIVMEYRKLLTTQPGKPELNIMA